MPIPLRGDFDAQTTRGAARQAKDGGQVRRLLALAAIYDGATRTQAAKLGGVTVQIVRDWVLKFNALGPDGLIDRKAPGQPSRLNDEHRKALATMIASGPTPAIHGVVRWRLIGAESCAPWAIVNCRRGRAITRRKRAQSRILKKSPGARGGNRRERRHRCGRCRNLVRR